MLKIFFHIAFIASCFSLGACVTASSSNTAISIAVNSPNFATPEPVFNKNVLRTSECDPNVKPEDFLTRQELKALSDYRIVDWSRGDKSDYYYVLPAELVPNCKLRVEIGHFIQAATMGPVKEQYRKFARKNSKEIVRVIRHIWYSPGFARDGMHHEKFNVFDKVGLKEEDVVPFLGDLLEIEGVNYMLMCEMLINSAPALKPYLSTALTKAESDKNIAFQVYLLIVLYQVSPDPVTLAKLDVLRSNSEISVSDRAKLKLITKNLKNRKNITCLDLDELHLPIDEFAAYLGEDAWQGVTARLINSN